MDCGANGCGLVYELTPTVSGWTKSVVHYFTGPDGVNPAGGVIFDSAGNLYGTAANGGSTGYGVVYELPPSGSGWTETVLYNFQGGGDGQYPEAGLTFDGSGNVYGATSFGGTNGGGTVFELARSADGWMAGHFIRFITSAARRMGPIVLSSWTKPVISTVLALPLESVSHN